ncbi:MAG: PEGA domain-containing protein [Deltaproteobacteria bacterium]|nr:PEGA domain-containing protein [Deltaproteobacteria bacterium]
MLVRLLLTLGAMLLLLWPQRADAQETTGVLYVTATIQRAAVHIDSEPVGEVPVTRYLPPGTYSVRVTADGMDPFVRRVEVKPNLTTSVTAELYPGGGTAEFVSTPSGASVTIDGKEVGKTPIRVASIAEGDHSYSLSLTGFETIEGTLTQRKGGNPLTKHVLESSRGRFAVTSKPAGAEVWLDGASVGKTPLQLSDVPPGQHTVLLISPGYAAVVRHIDTSDGSKGEVTATLSDAGTTLKVNTGFDDAIVRIDGATVSQGGDAELLLSRGEYLLTITSAEGGGEVSQTLEVPLTGTLLYKVDWKGGPALVELAPLVQRWTFWAALGGSAAAAGVVSAGVALALQPEPLPDGDVVVTLP